MAISKRCFEALQQAGQAVFAAREQFNKDVQANTANTVQLLTSEPFGHAADRAYAKLRAVARLAQDLEAIEEQLKNIYVSTEKMLYEQEQPAVAVLALPAATKPQRAEQNATAVDATLKQPTSPAANKKAVYAFLRNQLSSKGWKRIAIADVAKSIGVSKEGVENAVAQLVATGKLSSKGRGLYRLGA